MRFSRGIMPCYTASNMVQGRTEMCAQHPRDLEEMRRCPTLVAVLLDTQATIIDQILDLHDRVIGKFFADATRKLQEAFHPIHGESEVNTPPPP